MTRVDEPHPTSGLGHGGVHSHPNTQPSSPLAGTSVLPTMMGGAREDHDVDVDVGVAMEMHATERETGAQSQTQPSPAVASTSTPETMGLVPEASTLPSTSNSNTELDQAHHQLPAESSALPTSSAQVSSPESEPSNPSPDIANVNPNNANSPPPPPPQPSIPIPPPTPRTSVTFLLISNRRKTMSFDPETSVARVKELLWNAWDSDWQDSDSRPHAPAYIRLIYQGKVLQDEDMLSRLKLPTHTPSSTDATVIAPTPTIMHLSVRPAPPDRKSVV